MMGGLLHATKCEPVFFLNMFFFTTKMVLVQIFIYKYILLYIIYTV